MRTCKIQKIHTMRLSVSQCLVIVFVLSGKCAVKRFSSIKEFQAGDVFFINRHEVYALTSEEGCVVQWCELNDKQNRLLSMLDSIGSEEQEKEIAEIYRDCVFLKNLLQIGLSQNESTYIQEVIEALRADYQKVNQTLNDAMNSWLFDIMAEIEMYLNEKISLQKISKQLNMQKTNVATQFKQLTGMTLMEYVAETRLKKAEELLLFTKMSQQEILKACGFSDSKYFYRYFMEEFGMTPSQWKEKMNCYKTEKIEKLSTKESGTYLKKMFDQLSGLKTETKLYQQACFVRDLQKSCLLHQDYVIEADLLHHDNYIEAAGERINAWYGFDLLMNETRNSLNVIELKIRLDESVKQEEIDELFILLKKSSLRLSSKKLKNWRFVIELIDYHQIELANQIKRMIQREFASSEWTIKV